MGGHLVFDKYAYEALGNNAIQQGTNVINYSGSINLSDKSERDGNGSGNYFTGYGLINGSNADVGRFKITGTLNRVGKVKYTMQVHMEFNDIIDPNYVYLNDKRLSNFAKEQGYNCNDYILTVKGDYTYEF